MVGKTIGLNMDIDISIFLEAGDTKLAAPCASISTFSTCALSNSRSITTHVFFRDICKINLFSHRIACVSKEGCEFLAILIRVRVGGGSKCL